MRSATEVSERHGCFKNPGPVQIAVAPSIKQVPYVEPSLSPRPVRIAEDVQRAVVAQQVVELGRLGEFIDAVQVDQEQPPARLWACAYAVSVNRFASVIGAHADQVALGSDDVDELELLEHRTDG